MSAQDELYQDLILDHHRHPRNRGACEACARRARGENPLCGDSLEVGLTLDGGRIASASFDGHGCAISQASASMMTEAVAGLTVEEALALGAALRALLRGEPPARDLGELQALEGISRFPVRIKCALLAWTTLEQALGSAVAEVAR
jgi:nitrogen fixation NifU-like protein